MFITGLVTPDSYGHDSLVGGGAWATLVVRWEAATTNSVGAALGIDGRTRVVGRRAEYVVVTKKKERENDEWGWRQII